MDDATPHEVADRPAHPAGSTTGTAPDPSGHTTRRPSIAYLSYSSGEFDARTIRMARSAIAAGYDVTVYARWHPGLPPVEELDGYRLVRAPFDWQMAFPLLRGLARRRARRAMAAAVGRRRAPGTRAMPAAPPRTTGRAGSRPARRGCGRSSAAASGS